MPDRAFLSIVTISFNQKEFLRDTILSVLAQKSPDVQYIVVDPGSTDGSRQLISEYAGKIDTIIFEPDTGPADGLNKGFAAATGKVGYYINSDDFLLPTAIDKLRSHWAANPESDATAWGAWQVNRAGAPKLILRPAPISVRRLLSRQTPMIQHGHSFSMDLFRRIGGFNAKNKTIWDFELMCDMARQNVRIHNSWSRLGAFRVYAEQLSGAGAHQGGVDRMAADRARIREKLVGNAPNRLSRLNEKVARMTKHVIWPRRTLARLVDESVPRRREKLWLTETAGRGAKWMYDARV